MHAKRDDDDIQRTKGPKNPSDSNRHSSYGYRACTQPLDETSLVAISDLITMGETGGEECFA